MYFFNNITLSLFFIFIIHIFIFSLNLKRFFIKSNNLGRWSDHKAYLIGGIIFLSFLIYFTTLSYLNFAVFFLDFYELFILFIFFLIGFYDDKFNLDGKYKILIYLFIIIFLNFYYTDNRYLFTNLLTIFILLVIFISINIIDNMDGIFSSFFFIVICSFVSLVYNNSNLIIISGLLSIILINLYFMYINIFKDKNYLGDSGSYLLSGFIIILYLKFKYLIELNSYSINYLILLFVTFAYPIYDFVYVCFYRILNKKSPFSGGIDHTSHFFSKYFNSDSKSLIFICGINLIYIVSNYFLILNKYNYYYNICLLLIFYAFLSILIFKFKSK